MSSSSQILDNEEIEFLLANSEEAPAEQESADVDATEQPVTMQGDLDRINLADIFQTLSMSRMEGVLRVHNPLETRQVYCKDGFARIVVPPRVIHQRIGQRLVHAGLITPQQLRAALMRQRKEGGPLGQILVDDGLLTSEDFQPILDSQVAEDLFALFTWQHGAFEFYQGPITDPGLREEFEACPEFEIGGLLLETARRDDEWTSILAALHSLDEVPTAASREVPENLGAIATALLRRADGATSFRDLAGQSPHPLFEVARAARDLVHAGHLVPVTDEEMVAVARARAEQGEQKQAVMQLQTLREREGERSVDVVRGLAKVLASCGERREAGLAMLEQAQLQTNPESALILAREACEHAPRNAATLSFLRTVLLVHSAPDSQELTACTLDLLDALLEEGRLETALEIIGDAQTTATTGTEIQLREVRIRQRMRDLPGAIGVLQQLADHFGETGDKERLRAVYETILKLDRSRSDVRKHLARLRRTRAGRIIRAAAMLVVCGLLASMGTIYWQQARHEAAVNAAQNEISALLATGDRVGARERLTHWADEVGPGEQLEDLRRQVDFADAAELRRLAEHARQRLGDRLAAAGECLRNGDVEGLFQIHGDVRHSDELRAEADQMLVERIDMVLNEVSRAAAEIAPHLPTEPDPLTDRRTLVASLARLQDTCRPDIRRAVDGFAGVLDRQELPSFLPEETRERIAKVIGESRETFKRVRFLAEAYTEALQRNDTQREFDPIFKEALRREGERDFAGALELYRRLQTVEAASPDLRAMFRDRVTRNATICKLLAALAKATETGHYETASQHLGALETAFPDVPFRELVRLPVRVTSRPGGATVVCNGAMVGVTPCTLACVPAHPNRLVLDLEGFARVQMDIPSDHSGGLEVLLELPPSFTRAHGAVVDVAPTVDDRGRTYLVDRAGIVTAFDDLEAPAVWDFRSQDLSGLLGKAVSAGQQVVFPSLDGTLRGLDRNDGSLLWSLANLPTEAPVACCGRHLVLAATDDRLCRIHLDTREQTSVPLPGANSAFLVAASGTVFAATRTGVAAWSLATLEPLWSRELPAAGERFVGVHGTSVVVLDDVGLICCLELADGTLRWQREEPTLLPAPPILDASATFVTTRTAARRLALADGSVQREQPLGTTRPAGRPVRSGARVLVPTARENVLVLDLPTANLLYSLDGGSRGTVAQPWQQGAVVALPDRTLRFYRSLP